MARQRTIGIRLSDEERAALDARAGREDRSRSDMGRLLILDGLGLRSQPPPAPIAASSARSERAAKRSDGHAYDGGPNLKCKVCGVSQARHP